MPLDSHQPHVGVREAVVSGSKLREICRQGKEHREGPIQAVFASGCLSVCVRNVRYGVRLCVSVARTPPLALVSPPLSSSSPASGGPGGRGESAGGTRRVSHDETLALEFFPAKPRPGLLGVKLERYGPALLHVEQLLEELAHVVVGLGRRLEEAARPALGLLLAGVRRHLTRLPFVALVADQHHRDALCVAALDLSYDFKDGPELFQALCRGD